MAITTVFDPKDYITTGTNIIKEFIETYIPDVDVTTEMPILDENYELERPIIYLENMPTSFVERNVGMGQIGNNGRKEKKINLNIMAYVIVSYDVGGSPMAKKIGGMLYYTFFANKDDLARVGLKNPACSSFREFPKDAQSHIFGGRCLITAKVSIYKTE